MTSPPLPLEEIEAALAKASKGPWRKFNSIYGNATIAIMQGDEPEYGERGYHVARWPEVIGWSGFESSDMPKSKRHADARLICLLRNHAPALLSELRTLRSRLQVAEEALRVIKNMQRLGATSDIVAWQRLADACQQIARSALMPRRGS